MHWCQCQRCNAVSCRFSSPRVNLRLFCFSFEDSFAFLLSEMCKNCLVLQGRVATYARCGGIFIIHSTANLLRSRLKFDRVMVCACIPVQHIYLPPAYARIPETPSAYRKCVDSIVIDISAGNVSASEYDNNKQLGQLCDCHIFRIFQHCSHTAYFFCINWQVRQQS